MKYSIFESFFEFLYSSNDWILWSRIIYYDFLSFGIFWTLTKFWRRWNILFLTRFLNCSNFMKHNILWISEMNDVLEFLKFWPNFEEDEIFEFLNRIWTFEFYKIVYSIISKFLKFKCWIYHLSNYHINPSKIRKVRFFSIPNFRV